MASWGGGDTAQAFLLYLFSQPGLRVYRPAGRKKKSASVLSFFGTKNVTARCSPAPPKGTRGATKRKNKPGPLLQPGLRVYRPAGRKKKLASVLSF